jgi:hypothetical protein
LRRLAEGADQGAAHPLGIPKAGDFSDAFDRLGGGLYALARHLDAQALQCLRRVVPFFTMGRLLQQANVAASEIGAWLRAQSLNRNRYRGRRD